MTIESQIGLSPRVEEALGELQALIASRYPEATFSVSVGEDPDGVYLTATVDVEDIGEVVDVFLDRTVDVQIAVGGTLDGILYYPPPPCSYASRT